MSLSRSADRSRIGRRAAVAAATVAALGASALLAPPAYAATTEIQILATNDFHGRLAAAPAMAAAVDTLRAQYPNTVFAAAGDLIGASTFESFIAHDKPTIDVLNEAGLEVSAVGNHELDQGYSDLIDRVMAPYDAVSNPYGGAQWQYIAANLKIKETGDPAVPATWMKTFGDVEVGFVGAVTEQLPSLVSPGGIAELEITSIVESVNTEAAGLVADGADIVVMLVHEGAPSTDCATMDDSGAWADIITSVSSDVDAIVSGHTHLAYNCSFPVAEWAADGRAVTERPVVSAGQYGTNLNQLVFAVDESGDVVAKSQGIIGALGGYGSDAEVASIVGAANLNAGALGAAPLGTIEGGFSRARLASGSDYRGGESTLGNLVAEVQRWATETPEAGSAEIAFMNPGGLRADMLGTDPGDGSYPRTLTYKQAADVQNFANTLVNMQLTGAQIKTVLEQQWQPTDAFNRLLSRPFLRLGVSEGFTYTYAQRYETEFQLDNPDTTDVDESTISYQRAYGTVTGMWLDGVPIDPATSYSVTVNSFLATGGDNFTEFASGTGTRDTGKIDLSTMVDYMAAFAATTALPVDYEQRAVEVVFPNGAPTVHNAGETVAFDVQSLAMTAPGDLNDAEIEVSLGGTVLGTFPVDNTRGSNLYDNYGKASVSVTLPANVPLGTSELVITGATTGTTAIVPLTIVPAVKTTLTAKVSGGKGGEPVVIDVRVNGKGAPSAATVVVEVDGISEPITVPVVDGVGSAVVTDLPAGTYAASATLLTGGGFAASSTTFKIKVK